MKLEITITIILGIVLNGLGLIALHQWSKFLEATPMLIVNIVAFLATILFIAIHINNVPRLTRKGKVVRCALILAMLIIMLTAPSCYNFLKADAINFQQWKLENFILFGILTLSTAIVYPTCIRFINRLSEKYQYR